MKTAPRIRVLFLTVLSLGSSASGSLIADTGFETSVILRMSKADLSGGLSFSHFPWERIGYVLEWETGLADVYPMDATQEIPSYLTNTMRGGPLFTILGKNFDRSEGFVKLDAATGVSYASWNLVYSAEPNRRTASFFAGVYPKIISSNGLMLGGDFKLEKDPEGWAPVFKIRVGYKF